MRLVHVGAAVLNQTPMAWEENRRNILAAIEQARRRNVTVLCLPELCISGYGCEDALFSSSTPTLALESLRAILPATKGMVVSLGLPLLYRNALFNAACLAVDGRPVGFAAKRHLAGDGIHYEPRWFKPWPAGVRAEYPWDNETLPIGDVFFRVGGISLGFEICEDAWVARRPGGAMALKGVDIILNPSASHFAFGKLETRKRFVLEGSRAFGVTYVYSNLVGNEAGRAIYDGGALIATAGKLMAAGPRFTYADALLTDAVVDVEATRMSQARTASFRPDLEDRGFDRVDVPFEWPPMAPEARTESHVSWEKSESLKEEEFARAVSLAMFDYLRKSKGKGFVLSLSGGADSSAVGLFVRLFVEFGVQELGRDKFLAKLSHIKGLASATSIDGIVFRLLACVYQKTENNSQTTEDAARSIARSLGAEWFLFDIGAISNSYVEMVEKALGSSLTWERDDIALQNIQARSRGPSVWLLANIRQALLLATSNRSEAAVGYATMDGDTCGGLCPISGIDKAFLLHWLRWMEVQGPEGLQAFPVLHVVTMQAPTAELRPPGDHQTDEADLMPYRVLDMIERAFLRDRLAPDEILERLAPELPQHSRARLMAWVERFFRLWARNQWKRERFAPGFHLDDVNLDPKTWCRWPILTGGFERELEDLVQLRRTEADAARENGHRPERFESIEDVAL